MKKFLAAAIALSGLVVAAPAHAEDRRPCVSTAEMNSIDASEWHSRQYLEDRWDVEGLGVERVLVYFGKTTLYPWCGHLSQFPRKFYGVEYVKRGKHELAANYVSKYEVHGNYIDPETGLPIQPLEP